MLRKEILGLLIFSFAFLGCFSTKISENNAKIIEENNDAIFLESFPGDRPSWVDFVPISDSELYFIGMSNYLASENVAREEARKDAFNQVLKYYGTVVRAQAQEKRTVKGLTSDLIDPYIESEEIIQSFAEGHVSQILPENYYTEKYLVGNKKEQWKCYVKCSISKKKVQEEIEKIDADMENREKAKLEAERLKHDVKIKINVSGDKSGRIETKIKSILSENGFTVASNGENHILTATVDIRESVSSTIYSIYPQITVEIKNETEVVASFAKSLERVSAYKSERVQEMALVRLEDVLEKEFENECLK